MSTTTPDFRYERLGGAQWPIIAQRRLNRWHMFLSPSDDDAISQLMADDFFGTTTADPVAPVATVVYAPTGGMMLKPLRPREKRREKVFKDEEPAPRPVVMIGSVRVDLPFDVECRATLRVSGVGESTVAPSIEWVGRGTVRVKGRIVTAVKTTAVSRMTAVVTGRSNDDEEALALIIAALED